MMTIYLALDGYGPACNVSGDGAITLIIDRFFAKNMHLRNNKRSISKSDYVVILCHVFFLYRGKNN